MRAEANEYTRQGVPLLASLLAEAMMVGTGVRPVQSGKPQVADDDHGPSRGARIAMTVKRWLAGIDRWLQRQSMSRRDAYLAQSQDIFDLEERIRRLDRGERVHW